MTAAGAVAAEAAALVRIPSVTGAERAALEHLERRARALALRPTLIEHDLAAVRARRAGRGRRCRATSC